MPACLGGVARVARHADAHRTARLVVCAASILGAAPVLLAGRATPAQSARARVGAVAAAHATLRQGIVCASLAGEGTTAACVLARAHAAT